MLAGNLTYFFSARVTSAEQPYQVAIGRSKVNFLIQKLEKKIDGRIRLLETEVEKLKQESEGLKKNFTNYKTKTDKELKELNELRELLKGLSAS
jgi:FtsZ-binding cell division protein ZapB